MSSGDRSRPIDDVYTKPEVAGFFKVSIKTVERWIEEKQLASVKLGKRGVRVTGAALREFLYKGAEPR